ncbi:ATP-binding protein [Streptomyces sp. NPDC048442]|uniref:sensor histidine kinase n=1 Tax=Streptomyces sp. NPDC048442 TaxID=3154823 RepID=UPI0034334238
MIPRTLPDVLRPSDAPQSQAARCSRDTLAVRSHERRNALHILYGLMELAEHAKRHPGSGAASPGPPFAEILDAGSRIEVPLVLAQLIGKAMVAEQRGVALRLSPQSVLSGRPGQAEDIVTVLGNLVDNALDAVTGGGIVDPRVEISLREDEECVELAVADNGPGVPPDLRRRIFVPGFSTKPRTGVRARGLGLALIRAVTLQGGGTVTVADRDDGGRGAVFTVRMAAGPRGDALRRPAARGAAARGAAVREAAPRGAVGSLR